MVLVVKLLLESLEIAFNLQPFIVLYKSLKAFYISKMGQSFLALQAWSVGLLDACISYNFFVKPTADANLTWEIPFIMNGDSFVSSLTARIVIVFLDIHMSFSGDEFYIFLVILRIQGFLVSGCEMFSVHAVINVALDRTQCNVVNFIDMRRYSQIWTLKISGILIWHNSAHFSIVTSECLVHWTALGIMLIWSYIYSPDVGKYCSMLVDWPPCIVFISYITLYTFLPSISKGPV